MESLTRINHAPRVKVDRHSNEAPPGRNNACDRQSGEDCGQPLSTGEHREKS